MDKIFFDDLADKVCVITGGGGVICSSLARDLASAGVITAILDIDQNKAEKISNEINKEFEVNSIAIKADVLDNESLIHAKSIINKELGSIDLLLNGAGGNSPGATTAVEQINKENLKDLSNTFYGLDINSFKQVFDLNFIGTLLPTMIFSKDMLVSGKGVVLNISSMNSFKPLTKIPAYSSAKASINNFTEWLAVHLAKTGVRVNAIAPGFFLTDQNYFLLIDDKTGKPTKRGEKIINATPVGRYGKPEDLGGIVLCLLSDISNFITGIVVPVDGGYSAFGGV